MSIYQQAKAMAVQQAEQDALAAAELERKQEEFVKEHIAEASAALTEVRAAFDAAAADIIKEEGRARIFDDFQNSEGYSLHFEFWLPKALDPNPERYGFSIYVPGDKSLGIEVSGRLIGLTPQAYRLESALRDPQRTGRITQLLKKFMIDVIQSVQKH